MAKERAGLDIGNEQIDIEELTGTPKQPQDNKQLKKALQEAGKETGFISREPAAKKERKRSPYIVQKNIKMRVGMAELLESLTSSIEGSKSDQETLEKAMAALMEKEELEDLLQKYNELVIE